ncbi:hypothetical protein Sjap_023680 [Stephania japonica]|uniref:Uncharacterized protein n=1 Tax=Stephania japonica TaxID=461633 RepID=A0AAP0EJC4_9MAGN
MAFSAKMVAVFACVSVLMLAVAAQEHERQVVKASSPSPPPSRASIVSVPSFAAGLIEDCCGCWIVVDDDLEDYDDLEEKRKNEKKRATELQNGRNYPLFNDTVV